MAPGELVTFWGLRFGPDAGAQLKLDSSGKIATELSGVRVFFNDIAAPLLYAQSLQINAQVPWELAGKSTAQVHVEYNGVSTRTGIVQAAAVRAGVLSCSIRLSAGRDRQSGRHAQLGRESGSGRISGLNLRKWRRPDESGERYGRTVSGEATRAPLAAGFHLCSMAVAVARCPVCRRCADVHVRTLPNQFPNPRGLAALRCPPRGRKDRKRIHRRPHLGNHSDKVGQASGLPRPTKIEDRRMWPTAVLVLFLAFQSNYYELGMKALDEKRYQDAVDNLRQRHRSRAARTTACTSTWRWPTA